MPLSGIAKDDPHELAFGRLSRVLGEDQARRTMDQVLGELGIELKTADDLLAFADALKEKGGFEGAVGAMLGVAAVLRGARRGPIKGG